MRSRRFRCAIVPLLLFVLLLTALAAFEGIVWPGPGDDVLAKDQLTVDVTNASDGYILCRGKETDKRYKLRIRKGDETLTYDLNNRGEYEVFPLQMGSGSYDILLYRNTGGKKYAGAGEIKLKAELTREDAAFLIPSQYVDYSADSAVVALSETLCASCGTDAEKLDAVREWVADNFLYDYVKALNVKPGTLPDIEDCIERKMGICQDFAAMTAALFRLQGIPCELVIGYADKAYHAWNEVTVNGERVRYDPTMDITGGKVRAYTVERVY